ncbi:membrane-targeted effector domain-containing toxin [Pseudomonas sp. COW5]|uniref:membrane-targeted effector domain-containing toxin n=1 Tax=Pseudomonas sp. COW5 TaxID=2981253 RepID=UPI0022469D03|nr:membrane-targeted effector domain-containing toxin [Pseudomonas sp. COW5]MCX2544542.1 membrane-targeted effector domain-containing toxin [Pseudomonas sp. COW5]
MTPAAPRPLPNAADKAALRIMATQLVRACPSLNDTAHAVASELLIRRGLAGLDPDYIYFHRFRTAQSLSASFTGWQHYGERPYESLTLTQLVIQRFRATDQDNADLLDVYGGFYSAGPDAETFDATNEVCLHGNEVMRDFWEINFSERYRNELQAFWNQYPGEFRILAKCNFLGRAVEARELGHLSDEDFQTAVSAVIGPLTWPVSLDTLQAQFLPGHGPRVCALDIAGHVASDILRIVDSHGRQIIYVPGDSEAFHVLETSTDLHWWALQQLNENAPRALFLKHFPLADRHSMTENISDLMNRLVSTWGHSDHHLINQNDLAITTDAFDWLRDTTRNAMFAEADLSLTSNGDLRKKLWIGYLSAGLKVLGPMAVVGWPVALPVIGASLVDMGLNIDKAVNGKTSEERKEGVLGAIFSGIDALFNIPFLMGSGALPELEVPSEASEASELAETDTAAVKEPEEPNEILPVLQEQPSATSETVQVRQIPQHFQSNEILDGLDPVGEPGQYQGIYRLNANPPYAIRMNDTTYYVRYFSDSQGGGFWAIIDPARPNQLIHAIPVRLNSEGLWERMTQLGLKGGGQCLGRQCTVDVALELDTRAPSPEEQEHPITQSAPSNPLPVEPRPSTSNDIRLIRTAYAVDPQRELELRRWALNLRETHIELRVGPDGGLVSPNRYALYFAEKYRALQISARRFYKNLPWANLPPRPQIPALSSSTSFTDFTAQALEQARGLVIGETPGRITSMRLIIENMPALARQGVRTLYVRRLLSDFAQADLNAYFRSGVMSDDLQQYLSRLGTDPAEQFDELALVKSARQNGIRVQATDCAATYKKPVSLTLSEEQIIANHLTADIMFLDKTMNDVGKWVVLTGVENTNTFRGIAGISELEGGIGVRIEEVDPGQGERLATDPGIDIERGPHSQTLTQQGTLETHYADVLLQMEAAPVSRTELQIHRLLYRAGMYFFDRSQGAYRLFHRSVNGEIVQTPVRTFADGRYYIDRPSWGSVHRVPFDSLEQLSSALKQLGLQLQSRLPA